MTRKPLIDILVHVFFKHHNSGARVGIAAFVRALDLTGFSEAVVTHHEEMIELLTVIRAPSIRTLAAKIKKIVEGVRGAKYEINLIKVDDVPWTTISGEV